MSIYGISSITDSIPAGYSTPSSDRTCCNDAEKLEKQDGPGEETTQKSNELTQEEQKEVRELQNRDQDVRAHEMAHIAAGGQYVRGGASFEYETGPDGKRYAVGGEVSIDTSAVSGDPEATIRKMQVVRRAALAPAEPSGQDRAVAASASQKESKARQEQVREKKEAHKSDNQNQTPIPENSPKKITGYTKSGITISTNQTTSSSLINLIA